MRYSTRTIIMVCAFLACQAAKILVVFPLNPHSHFILGFRLVKELTDRGHQVTFISAFPQKDPIRNLSEISVAQVRKSSKDRKRNFFMFGKYSYIKQLLWLSNIGHNITEEVLKDEKVQQLLQSDEKFDLVLIEQFVNDGLVIFQHKFQCPLIALAPSFPSVFNTHHFASPSQPAYVPNMVTNFGPHMTLLERAMNFYYDVIGELFIHYAVIPGQNEVLQRTVPGAPNLKDILYNASFLFLYSHISLNAPFPLQPNMIEIGGYHMLPPTPLPKELREFLDNAKEGVVVFTMGANLMTEILPVEKMNAILKVFSRLKQKVLWKFATDPPGKPDNVKIMKWIPQRDVLAHPNVVVFITHMGLLGKTEALYHGVPLLGLPVFWDQNMNIADAVHKGFGLSVPFHTLTEKDFDWALNELLNNPKYKENAKKWSRIMHDQPMKPMDKAMYWIEYAIRHKGAPHYRTTALDLRWYQRLMLDVVFVIVLTAAAILVVIFFVLKSLFNVKVKRFSKKKKTE